MIGNNEKIHSRLLFLESQEDIKKLKVFSDIEIDYESFSLGGVLFESNEYIYPVGGGFDIGCGVCIYRVEGKINIDNFKRIVTEQSIFSIERVKKKMRGYDEIFGIEKINENYVLGDIETGNHFLELVEDDKKNFYILIHSGNNFGIKRVFMNFFLKCYKERLQIKNSDDNGYNLKIHREDEEGIEFLTLCNLAMEIAKENRDYIAVQISKRIGSKCSCVIDTFHEFVMRKNGSIVHSNGVQKLNKIDDFTYQGVLLCGYGIPTILFEVDDLEGYYNHGIICKEIDGKRVYDGFDLIKNSKYFKEKIKIKEELIPKIICKKVGRKYDYRIL